MAELGGMLLGGGLVLFASFAAAAASNFSRSDEPSAEAAMNNFNASHDIATKDGCSDYLILSPKFTDNYTVLKMALLRHGIILRLHEGEQFATLDLTSLIEDLPTFTSERRLNAALLAAGIIVSPGEAHGIKEPGFFRICCPYISPAQVTDLTTRLNMITRTFSLTGESVLTKRPAPSSFAVSAASPSNGKGGDGQKSAPSTAKKAPKSARKKAAANGQEDESGAEPSTATKKRRTAKKTAAQD